VAQATCDALLSSLHLTTGYAIVVVRSRSKTVFGPVDSADKTVATSVESEKMGGGNGEQNVGDDTASSGNIKSTRVDGVQLAGGAGQHEYPNGETYLCYLETRSASVWWTSTRMYIMYRIKFKVLKVCEPRERDTTYLGYAHTA